MNHFGENISGMLESFNDTVQEFSVKTKSHQSKLEDQNGYLKFQNKNFESEVKLGIWEFG